jgi:hypothetical protein
MQLIRFLIIVIAKLKKALEKVDLLKFLTSILRQ